MFSRFSRLIAAAALALGMAGGVQASTLGMTTIVPVFTPNATIDRTPGSFGSGSATSVLPFGLDLSVKYPITALPSAGVFEHAGSQLILDEFISFLPADTATASNFVVNVPALGVFANVTVNGSDFANGAAVQLFDIVVPKLDFIADAGFVRLNYTEAFAAAYNSLFALGPFKVREGDLFGYAKVELAPIPLPASALLLVVGVGALGVFRVRASRKT